MREFDRLEPASGIATGPAAGSCAPHHCAYFLDFDGTLVEIAEHPAWVDVDPDLLSLVAALHRVAAGAVAIVSGRPIADIDRLFEPIRLPAAGQHGAEWRDASGSVHRQAFDERGLAMLRAAAREWRRRFPELVVEDKGLSIAFHFRRQPEMAGELEALLSERIQQLGRSFQLQHGKMVLEAKPAGIDKGRAIRRFLDDPPFRGRQPVFIGDDATDEHGFALVNSLGGLSIKVGHGASVARVRLKDVDAVRGWLRRMLMEHGHD